MVKKVTIEHRPVAMPSDQLRSPKYTNAKMENSVCRMCLRPREIRPHLTRHHLVPESWFNRQPRRLREIRNAHANIIPLCRPCHDLVESKDRHEREMARRHLRRSLTQEEIAFAIQIRGLPWLDLEYPRI